MKKKQFMYGFSAILFAGILTLTSCKKKQQEKNDDEPQDTEQGTMSDNNTAESYMADIVSIGSQGSENGTLTTYKMGNPAEVVNIPMGSEYLISSSCATLSFNATAKTFTVDFGTTPCICSDLRYRSGKLFFDYSGSTSFPTAYRMPGFKMSITSSGYVVDGYTVNISNKTITNTTPSSITPGPNPGTNLTWSITANVTINKPATAGGGTITWNCNRTKELVNTSDPNCYGGQGVPVDWTKAKIRLNGTASGINASNETYAAKMTNLTRDFNCAWPAKGAWIEGNLDFTPGTRYTRYINFGTVGSGACDRTATVTINGQTYTFNF